MNYGARDAYWAPIESEADDAMPTYGTATKFDGINESAETLNFAEASGYGDNAEMIEISEFSNGEVAAKAVEISTDLSADIYGTDTDDDGGLAFGSEDNPPYGGYGFISNRMDADKNKFYEVIFYPKVTGKPEGVTYKTKEDGYTLVYDSLKFKVYKANNDKYKITKRFSTYSSASSYLAGLFTGTSTVPGATASA